MKKILRSVSILLICSAALLFSCCSGKKTQEIDTSLAIQLEINETSLVDPLNTQDLFKQNVKDFTGQICIVFAHGFNSDEFREQALQNIDDIFGKTDTGDLIYSVVFPGDLRNRIMNLKEELNSRDIKALIILGAPQNTHYMIAQVQDFWEQNVPYPIFSYCPKDDIAGQEASCTFILEPVSAEKSQDDENIEEGSEHDEESNELLEKKLQDIALDFIDNTIRFVINMPEPLPLDADLMTHAKNICGERRIQRYVDNETGLKPINHFTFIP